MHRITRLHSEGTARAVLIYSSLLPAVTAAAWIGLNVLGPGVGKSQFGFDGGTLFGGWAQWDAGWYYQIAQHGYSLHRPDIQSPVAFFPGYAMVMRFGGRVVGDHALAGVLTTITCCSPGWPAR